MVNIRIVLLEALLALTCQTQGQKKVYYGESHRSAWDRSEDHRNAIRTQNEEYAIVKHWKNDHQNEKPNFQFEVVKAFRSSLERQINEAILIELEDNNNLLNSKAEWGSNRIPRLILDPEAAQGHQAKHASNASHVQHDNHGQDIQLLDSHVHSQSPSPSTALTKRHSAHIESDDMHNNKKLRFSITQYFPTIASSNSCSSRPEVNTHAINCSREVPIESSRKCKKQSRSSDIVQSMDNT